MKGLDALLRGLWNDDPDERISSTSELAEYLWNFKFANPPPGPDESFTTDELGKTVNEILKVVVSRKGSAGSFYCVGLIDPSVSKDVFGAYLLQHPDGYSEEETHSILIAVENIAGWIRTKLGKPEVKKYLVKYGLDGFIDRANSSSHEETQEVTQRLREYLDK